jgi:hypothetical protein
MFLYHPYQNAELREAGCLTAVTPVPQQHRVHGRSPAQQNESFRIDTPSTAGTVTCHHPSYPDPAWPREGLVSGCMVHSVMPCPPPNKT